MIFTENQRKLLKEFCSRCYWYGEETGDYDMKNVEFDEMLDELQDDWNDDLLKDVVEST